MVLMTIKLIFGKHFHLVYSVKLDKNELSDTHGDIVVAHLGADQLESQQVSGNFWFPDSDTSDALSNAIALMTSTAIILL